MLTTAVWEPYDSVVWPVGANQDFINAVEVWSQSYVEMSGDVCFIDGEAVAPGDVLVRAKTPHAVTAVYTPEDFAARFTVP